VNPGWQPHRRPIPARHPRPGTGRRPPRRPPAPASSPPGSGSPHPSPPLRESAAQSVAPPDRSGPAGSRIQPGGTDLRYLPGGHRAHGPPPGASRPGSTRRVRTA
jgi:hypothetical protein